MENESSLKQVMGGEDREFWNTWGREGGGRQGNGKSKEQPSDPPLGWKQPFYLE